ncbi:MAG: very short patch repair endonuclease [Candidatus Melainabacteria bacterium]|nr:very short patch repair endonuclease [Candidatus Melainabacteria bacterium]
MSRSEQMKRVKSKDSKAEKALRSALHKKGLRYRIHSRIEGVTVDIVFVRSRLAVMVDGCFWHGCPLHATFPKTNEAYWLPKLAENKERDSRQTKKLADAGWTVIRAWEHECLPPSPFLVSRIIRSVEEHG